jgi:DNA-binding PadR family transcriptional regulator
MHLTERYWEERELYSGLVRLHILQHAQEGGTFGLGLIEELARHGYKLSAGTLYPLLHSMERKGLLRSHDHLEAGRIRRVYTSTPRGRKALSLAKEKVYELFGALFQDEPTHKEGRKSRS